MLNMHWIKWAKDVHNRLYEEVSSTREELKTLSPEELTDIGFICKEIYEQLDSIRKETEALKGLAEKIACLKAVTSEKMKLFGKLATGTPDVSMSANLPHPEKNAEAHVALCEYFGIPLEAAGMIRFHWPSFSEFFTEKMAQGKPVPPGIELEKTHAHYKLKYRRKTNA